MLGCSPSSHAPILFSRIVYVQHILAFMPLGSVIRALQLRLVSSVFAEAIMEYSHDMWRNLAPQLLACFNAKTKRCLERLERIATGSTDATAVHAAAAHDGPFAWLLRRALTLENRYEFINRPLTHLVGSWTMASLAASSNNGIVLRMLLDAGADPVDSVYWALSNNAKETIDILMSEKPYERNLSVSAAAAARSRQLSSNVAGKRYYSRFSNDGHGYIVWEDEQLTASLTVSFAASRASVIDVKTIINDCRSGTTGDTALHVVAERGYHELVVRLLSMIQDVAAVNKKGQQALHLAAARGHAPIVKSLLEARCDPNRKCTMDNQCSAFHLACSRGRAACVAAMLNHEYDSQREEGSSASGSGELDVNTRDKGGVSALQAAILCGNEDSALQVVDLILSHPTFGARVDVNGTSLSGFSPFTSAVFMDYERVCALLLQKCPRLDKKAILSWRSSMFGDIQELMAEKASLSLRKLLEQNFTFEKKGE